MIKTHRLALMALVLFGFSAPVLAAATPPAPPPASSPQTVPAPFTWAPDYAISWQQVCETGTFTVNYTVGGMNSRNEFQTPAGPAVTIFNRDKKEVISVIAGTLSVLPFSHFHGDKRMQPPAPPFPADAVWKNLGADKVDGKSATKYEVSSSPNQVFTVWLGDDKMPLRFQHGTTVSTVISYKPGPQDPALFEIPKD